ncbi:MAG: CRTAC1 family protein [Verrucomicrobiae bacterium]|nr:CRTAC1 family protein [Verrucomicrobiae bacterium]
MPVLGALALGAAFMVHARRHDLKLPISIPFLENHPGILPPEEKAPESAPRQDFQEIEKWTGHTVTEILETLEANQEAGPPATEISFPETAGIDPYLPRYVRAPDAAALNADDVAVWNGHLLGSKNGLPLSVPGLNTTGGRLLLPADFDRDGDLDWFVGRAAGLPHSLLRQGKDGVFSDVTTAAGLLCFLPTDQAEWIDFDRDGDLDLMLLSGSVTNDAPSSLRLFHNLDGNRFVDATDQLELGKLTTQPIRSFSWHDVDGDRFPDLLLSLRDGLMLCLALPADAAEDWRFEDATAIYGLGNLPGAGPTGWGDLECDGNPELLCATDGGVKVFHRDSEAAPFSPFIEISEALEISGVVPGPNQLLLEDLDCDGFLDLSVIGGTPDAPASRAWWNVGGLRFREIPGAAGLLASSPLRHARRIDPEGSGHASFFVSPTGNVEAAILNPSAETIADKSVAVISLKASETVETNVFGAVLDLVIRDESRTLSSLHLRVDEPEEIIGLGTALTIESLTVTWPDRQGTRTTFQDLPVNQRIEITTGSAEVTTSPLHPVGELSADGSNPDS